jgi:sugar/nucleoside kinase (ribokinase family)
MTEQAAIFAKLNHKLVMLDCGGRDDLISSALLKNVDFLSPNETELLRLAQDPNILGNQKDKM